MRFGQKNVFSRLKQTATYSVIAVAALSAFSCGKAPTADSSVQTVDIPNTVAKWQSIGNCWIYAALGWAESMALKVSDGATVLNLSETYLTYRHYEVQLQDSFLTEVETGGSFYESSSLIEKYGLMNEGDFIPSESEKTKSDVQNTATNYINASLKEGKLKTDRSAATVRAELDAAFGVVLADVQSKIFPASTVVVAKSADGKDITLDTQLYSWSEIRWPKDLRAENRPENLPAWNEKFTPTQSALLRRVKVALNAGQPVVMNWFVDFNALDTQGIFDASTLRKLGKPGSQGYHSTVIEDYVVEGVDPATNEPFVTTEGEVAEDLKVLAAKHGKIKYFVVKNSWGGAERLNRASYASNGIKGFHRLDSTYLFANLQRVNEKTRKFIRSETGVNGFILPPRF